MGEAFKFRAVAEEASKMLARDNDEMTAFGISEGILAFGTFNGYVHTLFLDTAEAFMLGPYSPIKDLSALGDSIAFISGNKVVLFNCKSHRETLATTVQDAQKISICSSLLGNTALLCATTSSVMTIQKGWVTTNVKPLRMTFSNIYEILAHGHLACIAEGCKVLVINLTNDLSIYERNVQWDIGRFHWASPTDMLVILGSEIDVVKYTQGTTQDSMEIIDNIKLDFTPFSIASFNQTNIVLLGAKLVILNANRECIFTAIPPIAGKLLSSNKPESPFFLVGGNQIFKVELPNAKEKIKILVHEYKFEEAYEITDRFKLEVNEVLYPQIEYLLKANRYEDAAVIINARLSQNDQLFNKLIQAFISEHKLHLIGHKIPYTEDESLNQKIIAHLSSHKDKLKSYLQKCPQHIITKPSILGKIKDLGIYDIVIDNFLTLGKSTEALKLALEVKSTKCFEILNLNPETFSLFIEIPNFLSVLFYLNYDLAAQLCEKNVLEPAKVIEWLPSDLIIKFLMKLEIDGTITEDLEKTLFSELLMHKPEGLINFIDKARFLNMENVAEAVCKTENDEAKVHVFTKLGNEEEVRKILNRNFDVRLKYIRSFPDLWPETLIEAKDSIEKTRQVLKSLHFYNDSISFIKTLEFKDYEDEIKEFIIKQGQILGIHKNSVNATKLEEFHYFQLLYIEYCKGINFSPPFVCCRCAQPLISVRLRKCGHHSHKDCFDKCIFCIDPCVLNKY